MLKRKMALMEKMGLNDEDATEDATVRATGAKR
jgi:ribosome assembly protein YihI (activator of Der GTPase)